MKSISLCRFTFTLKKLIPLNHSTLFKSVSFFAFLLITQFAYAQQPFGSIKGSVKTSDGKPGESVTITIQGTTRGTTVDQNGDFQLNKIKPGNYTLVTSLIGLTPQKQQITVKTGETLTVDIILSESSQRLQEVVITSGKVNKFTKQQSETVAKMPLLNLENPQVYTTVTKELLQDQLTVRYSDALKNVPGVIMQLENNNAGSTVTSRGFSTQSYLRNGVPGDVSSVTFDPINIETIEAIKGPSGALYGSSLISFGGLFNRVTKKPFDTFKGEIAYTGGGFGLSRFTADINTPLNADKTLLFRLNTAVHHEGSYQDAGFSSYVFVAPSLTYKIDDNTTLNIDGEYTSQKANNFYRIFVDGSYATGAHSPKDLNFDWNKRFIGDDITIRPKQANLFAQLDHKFSKQWSSRTNLSFLSGTEDGMSGYMVMTAHNDSLTRNMSYENYYNSYATDIQQNFNGDFHIGSMRNRLLTGLEFFSLSNRSNSAFTTFDKLNAANPGAAYTDLTAPALLSRVQTGPFSVSSSLQNTYSAYIQDVLNITDNFLAMASIRWDYFDNKGVKDASAGNIPDGAFHQSAFSPKFGLVYQVVPEKVSLFANYMNGFQNNSPGKQPDGTISSFKPSQANQWEAGAKFNVLGDKLSGSISYYDIKVKDILRSDYPARPDFTVQDGSQYSKGVEFQLISNPLRGFNVIAGYAYNSSQYKKVDPTLDGFRPGSAGPANLANLWLSYRLPEGSLKGFGLGFGGNYASKNAVINDSEDLFVLPSYTTLNASLSYEKSRYGITCKVDNLTDKKYWVGWVTTIPQMPARVSISGTIKF